MKRNLLDSLRYVAFAVAAGIASLAAVSCDKEKSKESPADVLKVTPRCAHNGCMLNISLARD